MNSSLKGLCDLIANQGAKYAHEHTGIFLEIIGNTTDKEISREQVDKVFKVFAFLNYALVNRIWSYIKNTTLQKDLKDQARKSIVLKTSYDLSEDKSNEKVAFLASELDHEFNELALKYNERIKGLGEMGVTVYANTAKIVILDWLREIFDLSYKEIGFIELRFNERVVNIARIEDSARQVKNEVSRRGRGFFKRIFGS